MCGIAGIILLNPSLVQQERLERMAAALQHRGPDGKGFWISEAKNVGLASTRLAIVDLNERAAQPLHYLHYTVIFNGEIYNYIELREELQKHGYTFNTQSDTEIIPAAYDYWGVQCFNHFDGMFAFALHDKKQQQLILARDRFGEKPLYYHAGNVYRGKFEQFVFASEMKALWTIGVDKSVNGTMLLNYLTLGYVQNPVKKTETFYNNILSLPQGHYLTIQPAEARVQMHLWYKPNLQASDIFRMSDTYAEEKFKELFFISVQRRLRSDVDIGTSLSGGIDSASIFFAANQIKAPHYSYKTFSAIFPGFQKDESNYIKRLLAFGDTEAYEKATFITPTADDWIKCFEELIYYQEEPLQSASVLAQFLVYKIAKEKGVTVLLDGQGADEILGGYIKYTHWFLQSLLKNGIENFRKEKNLLRQNDFLDEWSWKNYAAAYLPQTTANALHSRAVREQNKNHFINREFLLHHQNRSSLQKPIVRSLEDILYYNTFNFGLPELLRYADRNSMAHSREVRLPFLFHELVEFIFTLPSSCKIRNGFTKWILRVSMSENLPHEIVWRHGKTGFEPPQKEWMKNKQIQEMIMEARKKLVSKQVINPDVMNTPIHPQAAHEANNFDWRCLNTAQLLQ